jgi:hypothetical protein
MVEPAILRERATSVPRATRAGVAIDGAWEALTEFLGLKPHELHCVKNDVVW